MPEDNKNNDVSKKVKDQFNYIKKKIEDQLPAQKFKEQILQKRKELSPELQKFYEEEESLKSDKGRDKEDFYSANMSHSKTKAKRDQLSDSVSYVNKEKKRGAPLEALSSFRRDPDNITIDQKKAVIPKSLKTQFASFRSAGHNILLEHGIEDDSILKDLGNTGSGQEDLATPSTEAQLKADKKKSKDKLKIEKIDSKVDNKSAFGDRLLKRAIMYTVATWTLSMFYVYIHYFLSIQLITKKYFCKLGHEWVPAKLKKTSPEHAKTIGDKIGLFERPAVGCFCACHVFLIAIVIAIIYFLLNPWAVAWDFFTEIAKAAWSAVKGWLGFGDDD